MKMNENESLLIPAVQHERYQHIKAENIFFLRLTYSSKEHKSLFLLFHSKTCGSIKKNNYSVDRGIEPAYSSQGVNQATPNLNQYNIENDSIFLLVYTEMNMIMKLTRTKNYFKEKKSLQHDYKNTIIHKTKKAFKKSLFLSFFCFL